MSTTEPTNRLREAGRPRGERQPWMVFRPALAPLALLAVLLSAHAAAAGAAPAPAIPSPESLTSRELFNYGTQMLNQGKLPDAETLLTDLLDRQEESFQAPALYNLGHIRFRQGVKELSKGPQPGPAAAQGRAAIQRTTQAIVAADTALAGSDIDHLVAAYMNGRGARKELKSARRAVQRAIEVMGNTLRRWERASGDFKSALELNRKDPDAAHNADAVDRCIAKLVDSLRELQQMAQMMANQQQQLGEKMKQMKGRIPAEDMPPGAAGDDEEEEEQPQGPKPGQEEALSREGNEMPLTPEQAAALLEGYKLGDKRLPMGQQREGEEPKRKRETY